MSGFSGYLESYMKEHQITAAELAGELGVDRTTVFRWMKGKREPKSVELVMRIAQDLHMPAAARKALLEEYDKLLLGEEVVDGYKYVGRLFHDLKYAVLEASEEMKSAFWRREARVAEGMLCINSRKEISLCASALFSFLAGRKEEAALLLLVQPVYDEIQEALLAAFSEDASHVKIEQIICLEQRIQKSHESLTDLQRILPLCFAGISYEARYYYDFLPNHINEMSWMPNVILAGSCVLQFDYSMSSGIFMNDEAYAEGIRKQYEAFREKSAPLVFRCDDFPNSVSVFGEMVDEMVIQDIRKEKAVITIFHEPCMSVCISSDMYEKYLLPIPAKEQLIALMQVSHGNWRGMTYLPPSNGNKTKTYSYFQKEGLRKFMRTGIISEFPHKFYQPLPLEMRRLVLARMIEISKTGLVEYRMLPDDIELPEHMYCYWGTEERQLYLNYVKPMDMSQIQITEPGICRVFRHWLEYLEIKNRLCGVQETMEFLLGLLEEYGG